ncbi:uncharacterized protein LOC143018332 [Oratosquilla oratoria]|uniref:uncharacterized protein LOC143018332 n=1 Tax=Oratosquilla oratoria TaxID=337810 RepID=UPI003F7573E6
MQLVWLQGEIWWNRLPADRCNSTPQFCTSHMCATGERKSSGDGTRVVGVATSNVTVTTQELTPAPVTEQAYSGVPLLTPTGDGPIKGGLNIGGHTIPVIGQLHPMTHRICSRERRNNYGKSYLKVGAWNVHTLMDTRDTDRPERRIALVSRELARFNVDVDALSETRIPGEGQITEVGSGYTFFWKGKNLEDHHSQGVGFAVETQLVKAHNLTPHAINERITSLRLPLPKNQFIALESVCAPTLDAEDHVKGAFYQQLDAVISQIPAGDRLLLLGDFNARVGQEHELWHHIIGRQGVGNCNDNGLLLLGPCAEQELFIAHTQFRLPTRSKTTWKHPRSKHWHILDYAIVKQQKQKQGKSKDPDTSRAFQAAIQQDLPAREPSIDAEWTNIRDAINEAARTVIGYQSKQHQDWFDDNDENIKPLINAKRKARLALDQDPNSQSKKAKYAQAKSQCQARLREIQNEWWQQMAQDLQGYADSRDLKSFFVGTKKIFGPKHTAAGTLLAIDNTILSEDNEIQTRWIECFNTLLNRNSSAQQD